MQHAGGMLLPPVQTLVATIILPTRQNAYRVRPPAPKYKREAFASLFCFIVLRGTDSNPPKCNMPVACCSHRCRHRWLPFFIPSHRRSKKHEKGYPVRDNPFQFRYFKASTNSFCAGPSTKGLYTGTTSPAVFTYQHVCVPPAISTHTAKPT